MRANGRAIVRPHNLNSFAICDRCGGLWNHARLSFQYQYTGATMTRTSKLVCPKCIDRPNANLRAIKIAQDPTPVFDPRPQIYGDYSGDGRPTDGPVRLVYAGGPRQVYDPTLPSGVIMRAHPDFDAVDPDESEVFAVDFSRYVGTMPIDYALWSVETVFGDDQLPNEKVLGTTSISGAVVSHRMGNFIAGCIYKVTCTAMTPTGDGYSVWSRFACNTLK